MAKTKQLTSGKASAIIATLTAAAVLIAIFIAFEIHSVWHIVSLISIILGVFTVTFIGAYIVINNILAQRIKPLYKLIYQHEPNTSDIVNELEDSLLLENLSRDIATWSQSKSKEIDRLKEMERYRKEFVGNVSHELKTPIFNIQGYVLTLLDGGLEDPTINRKFLERTEKSIDRLISIVEDLEAINKLEVGELKLEPIKFNFVGLVNEVFESLEQRARSKAITLKFDKPYPQGVWVFADRKKIYQVVHNLVINSIIYGANEGRTIVSLSETETRVIIQVNDNGIGIDSKNIPRIFERFYRVDKSRSREQGGTGLGLAIVKHIIEAHKQNISVSSSLNKGTTFSFTLDRAK